MKRSKVLLSAVVLLTLSVRIQASQTMMTSMTKNFVKAYEECSNEYQLTESTANNLMNFWKEDFTTDDRSVGCAIHCLSSKLELIDPDGKLHHDNLSDFAKKHGSDESVTKQFIDILHTCEKGSAANDDKCVKALDVALCFKKEIHRLNWAPDPTLLLEEIMSESKA